MSKKVISQKIADRLRQATERASEFKTTYHRTVPLVGEGVANAKELSANLAEMSKQASLLYQHMATIYGYMQEGEQISEEHWNDIAQVATLAFNFDIFFQSDPKQLAHVLNVMDIANLEIALQNISSDRLVSIQKAIQRTIEKYKERPAQ